VEDDPIEMASEDDAPTRTARKGKAKGKAKGKGKSKATVEDININDDSTDAAAAAASKGKGKARSKGKAAAKPTAKDKDKGKGKAAASAPTSTTAPVPAPSPAAATAPVPDPATARAPVRGRAAAPTSTLTPAPGSSRANAPASAPTAGATQSRPGPRRLPTQLPSWDELAHEYERDKFPSAALAAGYMDEADPEMDDAVLTAITRRSSIVAYIEAALVVIRQGRQSVRGHVEFQQQMDAALRRWQHYETLAKRGCVPTDQNVFAAALQGARWPRAASLARARSPAPATGPASATTPDTARTVPTMLPTWYSLSQRHAIDMLPNIIIPGTTDDRDMEEAMAEAYVKHDVVGFIVPALMTIERRREMLWEYEEYREHMDDAVHRWTEYLKLAKQDVLPAHRSPSPDEPEAASPSRFAPHPLSESHLLSPHRSAAHANTRAHVSAGPSSSLLPPLPIVERTASSASSRVSIGGTQRTTTDTASHDADGASSDSDPIETSSSSPSMDADPIEQMSQMDVSSRYVHPYALFIDLLHLLARRC